MTLHEQYKAFIKKYEYYEPFHWLIKESFLDSIDCMIATTLEDISRFSFREPNKHYHIFMSNNLKHLHEQRELIANEK